MLYKFHPFSTSKELGKEYNAHCALVPNSDDWILIMDYDAMILTHGAYHIIEQVIAMYPHIEIFSATTNRLGYKWQRYQGSMSNDDSIRYHVGIAYQLERKHGTAITPIPTAGGFFLLFRKRYWEQNLFQEGIYSFGGKLFDFNFCRRASEEGKIARMMGVYVWHTYRLMTKRNDTQHLL